MVGDGEPAIGSRRVVGQQMQTGDLRGDTGEEAAQRLQWGRITGGDVIAVSDDERIGLTEPAVLAVLPWRWVLARSGRRVRQCPGGDLPQLLERGGGGVGAVEHRKVIAQSSH